MLKSVDVMKCKLVREKSVKYQAALNAENARDIFESLGVAENAEEVFVMLCLNSANQVTGFHEISRGTVNASLVHPREIFKRAILNNSANIILCHNHPSGNINPSSEDIEVTERLKNAGEILGINILDHIILTPAGTYLSFREQGMINN